MYISWSYDRNKYRKGKKKGWVRRQETGDRRRSDMGMGMGMGRGN